MTSDGDQIKVKLLAAYLRLADALHMDKTRNDEYLYQIYLMSNIPEEQRFHWIKARSIDAIIPNTDTLNITVKMIIPMEWDESKIKPLVNVFIETIQEELESVKNILIRGQISTFLDVVPNIGKMKDMDDEKIKDLENLLNDIEIVLSPNASKIISMVIDNLISICKNTDIKMAIKRVVEYEKFLINNVLKQRSCHVVLKKIYNIIVHHTADLEKSAKEKEMRTIVSAIKKKAESLKEDREKTKLLLKKNAAPLLMNGGNILLFGFSSSVVYALEDININIKDSMDIYICECRNKTRYEHGNKLSFSDSISYASEIAKLEFKNIYIISDCSVANILSRGKVDKVIFGTNGVDKEFNIGHTVGHLMIADLARAYNVPTFGVVSKKTHLKVNAF